jgi:energy-converting hydrogenase Eha subunit F
MDDTSGMADTSTMVPNSKIKWYYRDGKATTGYRTIWGYRRRTVFIVLGILIFALLALIIGLAVGLTLQNHNTPYPVPIPEQQLTRGLVKIYHYQETQGGYTLET